MADARPSDDLDERIARARAAEATRGAPRPRPQAKGYAQGSRVLAELVGAPGGAALLGWLLDRWLGTSPWALLVLLALGVVVAFRNIYRIGQEGAK